MQTRILRTGVLIGLVGGTAMAAFAMAAMWATGRGLFTVVNLFAGTFWQGAPTDGTFVPGAFVLGVSIHLVVSMFVGTVIAWLVARGQVDAGAIILLGVGIGTGAWVVQSFVWTAIDAEAQQQFTPWILATAHLVFALGAATFLTWLQRHDEPVAPGSTAPPEPAPGTLVERRPTRSGFTRPVGARVAGATTGRPAQDEMDPADS